LLAVVVMRSAARARAVSAAVRAPPNGYTSVAFAEDVELSMRTG
jgi:hypothetical protein